MKPEIGIVCGRCDRYHPIGTRTCVCGNDLSLGIVGPSSPPKADEKVDVAPQQETSSMEETRGYQLPSRNDKTEDTELSPRAEEMVSSREPAPEAPNPSVHAQLSEEELMEQARNYVCTSCAAPVPMGHKFCGRCGAPVPPDVLEARTKYYGDQQDPARGKLVLIRGEGMEGVVYYLEPGEHTAGKEGALAFPEDPFLSKKQATFFYRDGKLVVRDEGALNGVYVRIKDAVSVELGDTFLAGEQLFQIEENVIAEEPPEPDGTLFYGSPKFAGPFRIKQLFRGGVPGMTVTARSRTLQIGREGGDLNFPGDPYMSGTHCRIEENGGQLNLVDLKSRNGTYVRLKGERVLEHGDYLFLGTKLLRVEMNAS